MRRAFVFVLLASCSTLAAAPATTTTTTTTKTKKSQPKAPPPPPTTQQTIDRETEHLSRVSERLKKHAALGTNPYVQLELAIARRFLDRVQHLDDKHQQPPAWTRVQMKEVGQVLAHTEKTIDDVEAGKLAEEGLGPVPVLAGGEVKIDDGVFVTATKLPGEKEAKPRPYYFGGYGHFQQIVEDLPNFQSLGASIVQDGRDGPAQGLAKDYTLNATGRAVQAMLAAAAKGNVKVDILTSPHYFPEWAIAASPDMANGTPFQNLDHPAARKVIESWLTQLAAQNKNEPALLSYCLSNEPAYSSSGRDKFSAPAWHAFLARRHQSIDKLNELYGTTFKRFDEVPADGWKPTVEGQRWAYDWVCFNAEHFADWHHWMSETLKKQDPRALTHAKIMIFFALDNDKPAWGIDPELFCHATDIAGCDAYAQVGAGVGPMDETTSDDYAYHWQVQELSYDLLHSFANQPVFNSENHPMPNATGAHEYPAAQTRAVYWQGGSHHQGATTTWVWDEAHDPSLADSIYFRPSNIWGQGRAMLDLNRLSAEVTAINRAKPTVAIVYSPASIFWEKDYGTTVRKVYTALVFAGERVTFVSERQLQSNELPPVRRIVFPHVTHVSRAALLGSKTLVLPPGAPPVRPPLPTHVRPPAPGRQPSSAPASPPAPPPVSLPEDYFLPVSVATNCIFVGADCLKWDEYGRPRTLSDLPHQVANSDERALFASLPADNPVKLLDEKGDRAWGVEFCAVPYGSGYLLPVINHMNKPQMVKLSMEGMMDDAIDLLTRESVSTQKLTLEPMEPMLLRLDRR